jgi:hypothetical protein
MESAEIAADADVIECLDGCLKAASMVEGDALK